MARFNRPYDTSYFVVITRLSYTSDILPLSWCTTYMRACELEKSFSFDKHLAIKATDDFRLIYTHILVVNTCYISPDELKWLQTAKVTFNVKVIGIYAVL